MVKTVLARLNITFLNITSFFHSFLQQLVSHHKRTDFWLQKYSRYVRMYVQTDFSDFGIFRCPNLAGKCPLYSWFIMSPQKVLSQIYKTRNANHRTFSTKIKINIKYYHRDSTLKEAPEGAFFSTR